MFITSLNYTWIRALSQRAEFVRLENYVTFMYISAKWIWHMLSILFSILRIISSLVCKVDAKTLLYSNVCYDNALSWVDLCYSLLITLQVEIYRTSVYRFPFIYLDNVDVCAKRNTMVCWIGTNIKHDNLTTITVGCIQCYRTVILGFTLMEETCHDLFCRLEPVKNPEHQWYVPAAP